MTDMQVRYQALQEEKRKNAATESLRAREADIKAREAEIKQQEADIREKLYRLDARKEATNEVLGVVNSAVKVGDYVADAVSTVTNPLSGILKAVL